MNKIAIDYKLHSNRSLEIRDLNGLSVKEVTKELELREKEILIEFPSAFNITLHLNEAEVQLDFNIFKSQEEIERNEIAAMRYAVHQKNCRRTQYHTLKGEFENEVMSDGMS